MGGGPTVTEYRMYNWLSEGGRLWVVSTQILKAGDLCYWQKNL